MTNSSRRGLRAIALVLCLIFLMWTSSCTVWNPASFEVTGDAESTTLFVTVPCGTTWDLKREETAGAVTISVTYVEQPAMPACNDITEIKLDRPLGARKIIDKNTGQEVKLNPPFNPR